MTEPKDVNISETGRFVHADGGTIWFTNLIGGAEYEKRMSLCGSQKNAGGWFETDADLTCPECIELKKMDKGNLIRTYSNREPPQVCVSSLDVDGNTMTLCGTSSFGGFMVTKASVNCKTCLDLQKPDIKEKIQEAGENVKEVVSKADKVMDAIEPVIEKVAPIAEAAVSAAIPGSGVVIGAAKVAKEVAKAGVKSGLGIMANDGWKEVFEEDYDLHWETLSIERHENLGLTIMTSRMQCQESSNWLYRTVLTCDKGINPPVVSITSSQA